MIDYEYGGWNPMAMDLANYLNESMIDNAYPLKNGIEVYLDNCLSDTEVETLAKNYMKRYFEKYANEKLVEKYESNA